MPLSGTFCVPAHHVTPCLPSLGEVLLFFCFLPSVLITPEFLFIPLPQGPLETQVREIVSFPALLGDCELVI